MIVLTVYKKESVSKWLNTIKSGKMISNIIFAKNFIWIIIV